eukprot:gene26606-biopygen16983
MLREAEAEGCDGGGGSSRKFSPEAPEGK